VCVCVYIYIYIYIYIYVCMYNTSPNYSWDGKFDGKVSINTRFMFSVFFSKIL
jgi:hypothetical protein